MSFVDCIVDQKATQTVQPPPGKVGRVVATEIHPKRSTTLRGEMIEQARKTLM